MIKLLRKYYPESGLKKTKTDLMRGVLALYLVIIHARGNTILSDIPGINFVLMVSGQLICCFFFFMSGYGMMTAYLKKPDYLKNFLARRVFLLYFQYCIVLIISAIYRKTLLHELIDIWYLLRSIVFGGTYVFYGWYIQATLLVYLMFFAVYSLHINNALKKILIILFLVVYVIVAVMIDAKPMWYDSILAVALGLFVAEDQYTCEHTCEPEICTGGGYIDTIYCMLSFRFCFHCTW